MKNKMKSFNRRVKRGHIIIETVEVEKPDVRQEYANPVLGAIGGYTPQVVSEPSIEIIFKQRLKRGQVVRIK